MGLNIAHTRRPHPRIQQHWCCCGNYVPICGQLEMTLTHVTAPRGLTSLTSSGISAYWTKQGCMNAIISSKTNHTNVESLRYSPNGKFHGANMGPTWVLSTPDVLHVAPPLNFAMSAELKPMCWLFRLSFMQKQFMRKQLTKDTHTLCLISYNRG